MSLAKKVVVTLVAVVAIVLLSAVLAYKLIDDSVIENNALKALQDTLKRDVSVEGEFTLSRSLHPTLRTTGIRVASADWDKGNALLQAETLEIGIALLDLLSGNITIETIVFEDAIINIKRNAEGQSNLEFSSSNPPAEKDSGGTGAPIDVIDVKIKNLTVNYSDLQSESSFVYALDSFALQPINKDMVNITASSHFDQQPIVMESDMCRIRHLLKGENCTVKASIETQPFKTNINGNINIAQQGMLNLDVSSSADNINDLIYVQEFSLPDTEKIDVKTQLQGSFQQLALNNLDASIALDSASIKATGNVESLNTLKGVDISVSASASKPSWLDNYQQLLSSEYIENFTANASVQGDKQSLSINQLESTLKLPDTNIITTGNIAIQPELLLALDIEANGKHPGWLDELQEAIAAKQIDELIVKAHIKNQGNTYTINKLSSDITIDDTSTSATGDITIGEDSHIDINLAVESKGENLQSFDKVIKQTLPKSNNYSLATLFSFKNNIISLKELALTIDETQLQGNSQIELSSPPNIQADIKADTLNVEHLLATLGSDDTQDADKEEKQTESDASLFSDQAIELDWLQSADTQVSLLINKLIYKDATIKDIKASASAKNNVASIDISSLKYEGAALTSKTSVNANNNTYAYNLFTENFDLGKLLNDTDISDKLQGKIDASIDLNSTGKTSKQLAHNASGKLTSVMTQGSLADAPIDLLASNLLVELMPGKTKKDNTKIECMFMQFSGENGIFNSDAVLLNTENIVMTTNGSIDLTDEKLNLLLIPKPKNIELFTLDANIRVDGKLTDPGFSLDKGSVFKKLLKSAATVALGPAVLAVPFANMGGDKSEKCFSEVASTTTKAVEAQQEAERLAREKAEKEALEKERLEKEILDKADKETSD